jgi:hypothetical protein
MKFLSSLHAFHFRNSITFFGRLPGSALRRFLKGSFEDEGKDEHEGEHD